MVPNLVPRPAGEPDWEAPALGRLLRHFDERFARFDYLAGPDLSIADFCVVAMTIYFRRLGFPFERYPALSAWYRRLHALPAWRDTNAEPWLA